MNLSHLLNAWMTPLRRKNRPLTRRPALRVEALDDRLVPNGTPITDATQLAQLFPAHDGPTSLLINFNGTTGVAGHTVAAFTGTDQDKAEILFRVSEEFAPFNVQVSQVVGA